MVLEASINEAEETTQPPTSAIRGVPLKELPQRSAALKSECAPSTPASPFAQSISVLAKQAAEKSDSIREYESHAGRFYCQHCKGWVSPFFDSVEVAGPGFAFTNDQGMTLFRQTHKSETRVRCKDCGSTIQLSAEHMRDKTVKELQDIDRRLKDERRSEEKWQREQQEQKIWAAEQAVRDAKPRRRWFRCCVVWTLQTGCLAWQNWAHTHHAINIWSIAAFVFLALSINLAIWETPKRNNGLLTASLWLSFFASAITFFVQSMKFAEDL